MRRKIMLQILAATSNKHKIEEFRGAFRILEEKMKIITLDDIPAFPPAEETGVSFEENSMLKAQTASAFADMPAFADDSGLEVAALDGAPGVYSARFAGDNASDADRIAKLLDMMKGKTNRRARFVCVMSLAYRGTPVKSFRGEVNGEIIFEPRGSHGFGYDPVFVPDGYTQTFGELGSEIKEKISHRANALEKIVSFIKAELDSMDDFEFE
ncbi:MAG: RdgB/HAM1 family non-canonical purine NTP pyrophosphatase [Lentisphaeria bacterium]|nr:RdgB/HAM1 family non-canonical purine NTP pyrophosphatase [Lentisphaeria bacterium]